MHHIKSRLFNCKSKITIISVASDHITNRKQIPQGLHEDMDNVYQIHFNLPFAFISQMAGHQASDAHKFLSINVKARTEYVFIN